MDEYEGYTESQIKRLNLRQYVEYKARTDPGYAIANVLVDLVQAIQVVGHKGDDAAHAVAHQVGRLADAIIMMADALQTRK